MNVEECHDSDIHETLERAKRRAQSKGDDHLSLPSSVKRANVKAVRDEMQKEHWDRTMGRDLGILPRPGGVYNMNGPMLKWDPKPQRAEEPQPNPRRE